eukprot:gene7062-7855_t
MPSKVRFQTEYMSTFNKKDISQKVGIPSPILKPRCRIPDAVQTDNPRDPDCGEAGIPSASFHNIQEPPLQHKHIVAYDHNHNITKTDTVQWLINDQTAQADTCSTSSANPILDYDAVKHERNKQFQTKMKDQIEVQAEDLHEKYAGKSSENLQYLVLEPPMQRKRISSYERNHNILTTNTIGMNGYDESRKISDADMNGKAISDVKRKLEFKDRKDENEEECKGKQLEVMKNNDKDLNNTNTPKVSSSSNKYFEHKRESPTKVQRSKDLKDVKVDRALRIKAGLQTIESPLHTHHVKSEYQRQFAWKEPIVSKKHFPFPHYIGSDNNGKPNDVVVKKPPKPQKTEYQRQYKQYKYSILPDQEILDKEKELSEKSTIKDQQHSNPDKRLVQPSRNLQPLFFPHAGYDNTKTEYRANYQSPLKFQVEDGAWQGAIPPHCYTNKTQPANNKDHSDWFTEVLRLRKKAEQYKIRARQTQYPTTFYASLEQDDVSDKSEKTNSRDGSVLIDDNTINANLNNNKFSKQLAEDLRPDSVDESAKNGSKMAASKDKDEIVIRKEEDFVDHDDGIENVDEDDKRPATFSSTDSSDSRNDLLKGRIDTARLAKSEEHRRHNLDRTTPTRSGNIVTVGKKISTEIPANVYNFRSSDLKAIGYNAIASRKSSRKKKTSHEPDEQKKYNYSNYEDKENRTDLVLSDIEDVNANREEAREYKLLTKEIKKPPRAFVQPSDVSNKYGLMDNSKNDDIDALSETSFSARGSVISDVFERSKLRKDNFW